MTTLDTSSCLFDALNKAKVKFTTSEWIRYGFTKIAFENSKTVFQEQDRGLVLIGNENINNIHNDLAPLNGFFFEKSYDGLFINYRFLFKDGYFYYSTSIDYPNNDFFDYKIITIDETLFRKLKEIVNKYVSENKNIGEGSVFALVTDANGKLSSHELGVAGISFEPGNYSERVVNDFNHIVKDLGKPTPCGRIIILDGKPGTGKTFLLRSLLQTVKDTLFLIVPANLVSSLTSPSFLSVLTNLHINYCNEGKPIVLLIEDADECLINRGNDNISMISSVLNLSDGILGAMLDLRVICTTNVKITDIDPAISRPMRLCRHIPLEPLSLEQAKSVFKRLTGNDFLGYNKEMTLAEVYKKANFEASEDVNKTKKLGF